MSGSLDLLIAQPLFGVGLTLLAYALADAVWEASDRTPFLNPVLVAAAVVASTLLWLDIPYTTYRVQAAPINETLAVIVVLLAVPLCRQFERIRQARWPILAALAGGTVVAFASTLVLPVATAADDVLIASMAPKSATTAVAVQVTEQLGGVPGVAAVIVILTGIFGAAFGPTVLSLAGVSDVRAQGLALGIASHAIGTARAFQISETAGAFASIGMILHAIIVVIAAPIIFAALS